ncbi:hypothetical protein B0H19DRAFT_1233150 [Mycena capillaripes]|nr:hypothetical protein B0H19DRAFT_1233150 [Mycena capillaripes]
MGTNYRFQANQNLTTVYGLVTGHKLLNSEQDFCDILIYLSTSSGTSAETVLRPSSDLICAGVASIRRMKDWIPGAGRRRRSVEGRPADEDEHASGLPTYRRVRRYSKEDEWMRMCRSREIVGLEDHIRVDLQAGSQHTAVTRLHVNMNLIRWRRAGPRGVGEEPTGLAAGWEAGGARCIHVYGAGCGAGYSRIWLWLWGGRAGLSRSALREGRQVDSRESESPAWLVIVCPGVALDSPTTLLGLGRIRGRIRDGAEVSAFAKAWDDAG